MICSYSLWECTKPRYDSLLFKWRQMSGNLHFITHGIHTNVFDNIIWSRSAMTNKKKGVRGTDFVFSKWLNLNTWEIFWILLLSKPYHYMKPSSVLTCCIILRNHPNVANVHHYLVQKYGSASTLWSISFLSIFF